MVVLVVVLIVNQNCVIALKFKSQSPIAIYRYSPMAFEVTFKCMQAKTWCIHGLRRFDRIQQGQDDLQASRMHSLDAGLLSRQEKQLQPLV